MNLSARSIGRLLTAAVLCLIVVGSGTAQAAPCSVPTIPYPTIQSAINDVTCNPINVAAGTYVENVSIFRTVTLLGAQNGNDARGRVAAESIVTPLVPATRTLELRANSVPPTTPAGSIIDGFEFAGGTRAIESTSGPIDGIQIKNNRILGFSGSGVFLNDNGINITVDQNEIDGMAKVGTGDLFHLDQDNFDGLWFTNNSVANGLTATGFFVDGTRNVDKSTMGARTPQFVGNSINRNQTGVNLGRLAWGDGPIQDNVISNNLFDGLQGGPKNSLIETNLFDNNGRNGLALTSFGNTTDAARGAQNNTITFNCFTRNGFNLPPNNGAGISFSATQFPGTISTNKANDNNIIGNAMGARYALPGTETINAKSNWWGASDGPGLPDGPGSGDGVDGHGKIDFSNFRTTAIAGTPCSHGPSTSLTLSPKTATNPVGTQHCVTATVTNEFNVPLPGVTVVFTVTGSVNTSSSVTTDADGKAKFCYTGPALPGMDVIKAFADDNPADPNNGMQDPGEPFDTASKTWVLPVTTPGCEIIVTNGGWIIADNGDHANFGGNAKSDEDSNVSGQEEYQDKGPADPFNLHGDPLVITCGTDGTSATIFGQATIDGTGSHDFRIDVRDLGEPGKGQDHYRIQIETIYDSGDQVLQGGNVQIHKQ